MGHELRFWQVSTASSWRRLTTVGESEHASFMTHPYETATYAMLPHGTNSGTTGYVFPSFDLILANTRSLLQVYIQLDD